VAPLDAGGDGTRRQAAAHAPDLTGKGHLSSVSTAGCVGKDAGATGTVS
jgi:hypothetical protein